MGMAASQARYLSLQARMSNVEYQGQQINQERTILSQQATALYNSLLDMQVPTPPSTSDYSIITYTGSQGATSFELGKVVPNNDTYVVEINTDSVGSTLSRDPGVLRVYDVQEQKTLYKMKSDAVVPDKTYSASSLSNVYYVQPKLNQQEGEPTQYEYVPILSSDHWQDYFVETGDKTGYYTLKEGAHIDDGKIYSSSTKWSVDQQAQITADSKYKSKSIGNYETYAMDSEEAKELVERFGGSYDEYVRAIMNTFGTGINALTEKDFYIYLDTSGDTAEIKFARKGDVDSKIDTGWTDTYSYIANGKFTKHETKPQCKLKFDAAGRITQIGIPHYPKAPDGSEDTTQEPNSYDWIDVSASTSTDNAAYEDAYNQYEYKQYLYDKQVQELNAKTEIIQAEDRSLELRLQRLDNERTALKTEMDAVKKVISENIDNSYKTFSG